MPRFFFDFRQYDDLSTDTEGTELPGTDEAYLEAFKAAQEMWSDLLAKRLDPRRCRFQVRAADGQMLFVLPFVEVMESCRRDSPTANLADTFRTTCALGVRGNQANKELQLQMNTLRQTLEQSRALLLRQF